MSALSKFHSTRLSIQELLSGRIRLQRYGLFLKLKHLYPNKMQINFILATRLQRNRLTFPDFSRHLLLEEIGYVVETVSIFDRTTAVVHALINCYAPTIIKTYDTPSLFRITGMYHHLTFPDAQKKHGILNPCSLNTKIILCLSTYHLLHPHQLASDKLHDDFMERCTLTQRLDPWSCGISIDLFLSLLPLGFCLREFAILWL